MTRLDIKLAKSLIVLGLLCGLTNCSGTTRSEVAIEPLVTYMAEANFPLNLSEINFSDESRHIQFNDAITSMIEHTIESYNNNECINDSLHTVKDVYINTVVLRDSLNTLFLVLLRHHPTGYVNSRLLFYDNLKKEFTKESINLNLHAMYSIEGLELRNSNLKEHFQLELLPEIDRIDFDNDGRSDYRLSRLYHNGTSNAVLTAILKINELQVDTLSFENLALNK
uniref:hypothetical protein n=1 Tax=Roseivirga sp. TaxID=1964215 RepID=UPI00404847FA